MKSIPNAKSFLTCIEAAGSGKRCQRYDEGEMRLEVSEKLVIRGYEFAVFPLGQRLVQAIVKAAPRPGGNIDGTVVQGVDGMQNRRRIQDIKDEPSVLTQLNQFLPLRLGQAVGDLAGEVGRSHQFMDALLVFIAQPQGCRRQRSRNDTAERH